MSKKIIDRCVSDLFDVVEWNGTNTVSTSRAVETLRLVNTALSQEYAVSLVELSKPHDAPHLDRLAFSVAVQYALQNTDVQDALLVLRELTLRLRLAYRKQFLLPDVCARAAPAPLAGNPTAVAFFREFFDAEARGRPHISRAQLRALVAALLPGDPGAAAHCAKAALPEGDGDGIGFCEFAAVLQPVAARRPLSDLVEHMRCSRRSAPATAPTAPFASAAASASAFASAPIAPAPTAPFASAFAPAAFAPAASAPAASASAPTAPATSASASASATAPAASAFASAPAASAAAPLSEAEMERYRRREAESRRGFADRPGLGPALRGAAPIDRDECVTDETSAAMMEREVFRLRSENEELRRDLLRMQTRGPSVRIEEGGRTIEMHGDDFFNEENATLRAQLASMKEELYLCQSKIDIYEDLSGSRSELRMGLFSEESVRTVYPDEVALATRYKQLARLVERQQEALGRPARLFLSQIDAIAQGYQRLYRHLRESGGKTSAPTGKPCAQSTRRAPKTPRQPWID